MVTIKNFFPDTQITPRQRAMIGCVVSKFIKKEPVGQGERGNSIIEGFFF